jgi:branched-chain amino acid aminotransferase
MYVELDGELVAAADARVSPFDGGFLYGDGIFDTLRAYRGFAYSLEKHVERLAHEAELLQISFDPDIEAWRERIDRLLRANDLLAEDAVVRIQLSRGGDPDTDLVTVPPEVISPVTFVTARPVGPEVEIFQREGIRIMTVQSTFARGNFPQMKTLNYLPSIMALRFARASGFQEACLLNRQNRVLEGATSNVFLVRGKSLRTPSARLGLLPGITRNRVLELAHGLGLHVEEMASELRDLMLADEVFLTGSVKEIVPVVGVDRSTIGDGAVGPVTRGLQSAYREDVEAARARTAAS